MMKNNSFEALLAMLLKRMTKQGILEAILSQQYYEHKGPISYLNPSTSVRCCIVCSQYWSKYSASVLLSAYLYVCVCEGVFGPD